MHYVVDGSNRIVDVDDTWDAAATTALGGTGALRSSVVGRQLEACMVGDATKMFVRAALEAARVLQQTRVLPYRCDTPDQHRRFEMLISPLADGQVKVEHRLVAATPVALRNKPGIPGVLTGRRCSQCLQVRLSGSDAWVETELPPSAMLSQDVWRHLCEPPLRTRWPGAQPMKLPQASEPPAPSDQQADAAVAAPLPARPPPRPFVVGIGSSAGGLEALTAMLPNLPAGLGLTFIVVQHMSPTHRSLMVQLLGRTTSMPVLEVEDGCRPLADTVYVTPPNNNVVMAEDGRLRLLEPPNETVPKPSVNMFFESLAEVVTDRAIGVVLSGTGSDGAVGLHAIKAAGGFSFRAGTR